jgi:hypothetical protein
VKVLEHDQQGAAPERLGQQLGVRADPQPAAASAGQAVLGLGLAPRAQGRPRVVEDVGVVQVEEVAHRSAQGLFGRPTGQPDPGRIDAQDGVVLQHHEHVEAAFEEPVGGGLFDAGRRAPRRRLVAQVLAHPRSLVFNRYAHDRVKDALRRTACSIAAKNSTPTPPERPQEGYRLEHA